MSEQNQNTNTTITEPTTFSAIKDQLLGATKEVIGAVFNRDLQNAGAQQRIHGERELEALHNQASQTSGPVWSGTANPEKILMETSDPFGSTDPSVKTVLPTVESSEPSRGWLGTFVPLNTSSHPSEHARAWTGSADPEKVLMETSDPFGSTDPSVRPALPHVDPAIAAPSEPSRGWLGSLASMMPSSHPADPSKTHPNEHSHPSTISAIQNQIVGSTKEVVGAVFNENLQNSGAKQRIQGETDYQSLQHSLPQDQSTTSPVSSEPSKILAMKDQLLGSTKEVIGAVLSQNLHDAGVEQRIHGEREYETALMAQESQANWNQSVGTLKETVGSAFDDKKLQTQGLVQRSQGEVEKMVNA